MVRCGELARRLSFPRDEGCHTSPSSKVDRVREDLQFWNALKKLYEGFLAFSFRRRPSVPGGFERLDHKTTDCHRTESVLFASRRLNWGNVPFGKSFAQERRQLFFVLRSFQSSVSSDICRRRQFCIGRLHPSNSCQSRPSFQSNPTVINIFLVLMMFGTGTALDRETRKKRRIQILDAAGINRSVVPTVQSTESGLKR
jgi:hypothetical protein